MAWDIMWEETLGSAEMPPINKRQESISAASEAPCAELPEAPAKNGLPQ